MGNLGMNLSTVAVVDDNAYAELLALCKLCQASLEPVGLLNLMASRSG